MQRVRRRVHACTQARTSPTDLWTSSTAARRCTYRATTIPRPTSRATSSPAWQAHDAEQLAAVRRLAAMAARIAVSLIAHRLRSEASPSAATGARSNTFPTCTSKPATTSRSPGASPRATVGFEGGAAGRAQDGARPAAGADLLGPLARAPAVRAGGGRLPGPREGQGVANYLGRTETSVRPFKA